MLALNRQNDYDQHSLMIMKDQITQFLFHKKGIEGDKNKEDKRDYSVSKKLCVAAAVSSLLFAGCFQPPKLAKQTFTLELGADVYANPDVYLENADDVNSKKLSIEVETPGIAKLDNRFVSTGSEYLAVGEYDFVLVNGSKRTPFAVKIKDTKPPTITNDVTELSVGYGQIIDWASVFDAKDLSEVYYEAPLDASLVVGEQDITVRITDRFGNGVDRVVHLMVGV